jgi:hypothetical protein
LVAGIQQVGRALAAHSAVFNTPHDQPALVLILIERCRELQRAAEPVVSHAPLHGVPAGAQPLLTARTALTRNVVLQWAASR